MFGIRKLRIACATLKWFSVPLPVKKCVEVSGYPVVEKQQILSNLAL